MGPFDLLLHLLGFAAPALALAVAVPAASRVLLPRRAVGHAWWVPSALIFIAGVAVLAAGLWLFGVDGKMATYGALALCAGSVQWLLMRGWAR